MLTKFEIWCARTIFNLFVVMKRANRLKVQVMELSRNLQNEQIERQRMQEAVDVACIGLERESIALRAEVAAAVSANRVLQAQVRTRSHGPCRSLESSMICCCFRIYLILHFLDLPANNAAGLGTRSREASSGERAGGHN
jgi:hypothetical protein